MDRCALFIDAGHLLAEGGKLCCGTSSRRQVRCLHAQLVDALTRFAFDYCQIPVLRVYWYDAAPDAIPTHDQLEIAELDRVQLRLGRLSGGKQKGVDSLIVRDLMTLARERGGSARLAGQSFALEWTRLAASEDIRRLLEQAPIIPYPLDAQLVLSAERVLGSLRERKDLKRDLRAGFWEALQRHCAPPP